MNTSLLHCLLVIVLAVPYKVEAGQIARIPRAGIEEQNFMKGTAQATRITIPNGIASVLGVPVPYATITSAIAAAAAGDTIDIAAGSFVENVIVNKSVLIRGAGAASTFIVPSFIGANPGGGGSLPVGHSSVFLIEANDVTIEKMTVDGDNTSLISGIGKGGADIDARNGIITNHTLGTYNNLIVRNVTVKNIYLRGIYASSGGTFTLADNRVHNVQADSIGGASIGIFNFGGAGIIQRDTVSDCLDGVAANHSSGTQFLDNVVTGSGSGVHTDNAGDGGGVADWIEGNTVSNSTLYGYGIWVFVAYIAPTVQYNEVTNVDVGMGNFAGAFTPPTVTVQFLNNTIDGMSKANSAGFYITNTSFYFGTTNVAGRFESNIVRNNTDGFYIESDLGKTLILNASFNHITGNTNGVSESFVPVIYGGAGSVGTVAGTMNCNWWGHVSGPTIGSNPGGLGQTHSGTLGYAPWLIYGTDADLVPGFQLPTTITLTSGGDVSAADNDFRKIQNAVGCVVDNQTLDIQGLFDWSLPNALATYTASYNTSASADIRGAEIRAGINVATITSSPHNGHIIGAGDIVEGVSSIIWSSCLFADDGTTIGNNNLTIEYLHIDNFEAGVVFGWNGTGTFSGTTLQHNTVTLAGDDGDAADWIQNIAIYLSAGSNQTIDQNTVNFKANGTRTVGFSGPAPPASYGYQSSTTGGTGYTGLEITDNIFQVGATSNAIEEVYGIWENGHNDDNSSVMTISGNQFLGRTGDDLDHALKLSSQTTALSISDNIFTDVDNVYFANKSAGHTVGDRFTLTNGTLTRVGGADGIFIKNITNDVVPIHVAVYWDIASTIDGETGIRGLNELSTQATHASRASGGASDLDVVYAFGSRTTTAVDDSWGSPNRFTDPDGIGTGAGPVAYGFNTYATVQMGIDSVTNSTVYVLPGTYRGQVYINEPNLNLLSVAGAESTFVLPSLTVMAQPFLPFRSERPIIGVDSLGTNVVIDGFTVDGEGAGNTQAFMSGIQYFKGTGIVRNNTVKRIRSTPFDGTQAFIGILVSHDYPRSYTHAVEIHNDSVYDFGKAGIVCNHPGVTGDVHDNVIIGQGPTGLNAQAGIQFGFGSTGTIADNVVNNLSYTGGGTTASSILAFVTDGTVSIHGNSVNEGQAAINIQQSTSYPAWSANADVYANTVTASAAGTGVASYYGGITISAGGPAPSQPRAHGVSPGHPSPADLDKSPGTARALLMLNAMNVSFAGNVFTSSSPSDGIGLYLLALDTSPQTVTGDSNQFNGYGIGVVTDKDPGATLNTTWRKNKFVGNNYGMDDLTGVLQDAKQNWWDDASGPRDVKSLPNIPNYNNTGGLGDSVTAFVDYNPWYLDMAMTTLSQYTLSVIAGAHGAVTKSPDQPLYLHGTTVTLAAIPTAGYAFVGWTGDTITVEDTVDVDMTTNKSYVATFTNLLNVTVVGIGAVAKTPNQPTGYAPGASVGLKATPAVGWHFVSWSGDTTATADTLYVAFYTDKNYTATFAINLYALNIVIAGNGSVGRIPPGASYSYGTLVTLTANPGGSSSFVGWTGDTLTTDNPIVIGMDTVKNLIATFIGDKFLTVTPESLIQTGLDGKFIKPARRRRNEFPNWMNLIEETVVQGGFQPGATESDQAGGMRVGVSWMVPTGNGRYKPFSDSSHEHGWVRLTKWRTRVSAGAGYLSIPKTLYDRTGQHTGSPHGLDFFQLSLEPHHRLLLGQRLSMPPKRHNNKLFAEMVALKVNIAASLLGKMPVGFSDLIFYQPGNPVNGLSITKLAGRIDTAMTLWQGRATSEFDSLYSAVYRINRAFPSVIDTVSWAVGNKLVLNGNIRVGDVPFLQGPPPLTAPILLQITTDQTESDDEFDESEFEDEVGTPIAAKLDQNFPNPFNPGTIIGFRLRESSVVSLKLYDILGREVGTLLNNEELEEGEQWIDFIANNLATGTYLYRIEARSLDDPTLLTVDTRKMLLLK